MVNMKLITITLCLSIAILPGCGLVSIFFPSYSIPVNVKLAGVVNGCKNVDERWKDTGEIVVIASFSGGGKRAAALAFGVGSADTRGTS